MKHINDIYEVYEVYKSKDRLLTGFPSLDSIIGGLGRGELITIAGRPCNGMVSMVISLINNITINNQIPTAIFCLDLQQQEFVNHLLANISGTAYDKLKRNLLLTTEEADCIINCWIDILKVAPLYIGGFHSMKIEDIILSIKGLVSEHGIKLVFITYFQLIETTSENYNQIAKQLKWLARELEITIVVTSSLNWQMEEREGIEGKLPQLTDLRYVGDLDEVSDIVIGVFRPSAYQVYYDMRGNDLHDVLVLKVLKNGEEASNALQTMLINNETLAITDNCVKIIEL